MKNKNRNIPCFKKIFGGVNIKDNDKILDGLNKQVKKILTIQVTTKDGKLKVYRKFINECSLEDLKKAMEVLIDCDGELTRKKIIRNRIYKMSTKTIINEENELIMSELDKESDGVKRLIKTSLHGLKETDEYQDLLYECSFTDLQRVREILSKTDGFLNKKDLIEKMYINRSKPSKERKDEWLSWFKDQWNPVCRFVREGMGIRVEKEKNEEEERKYQKFILDLAS